MPRLRTFSAFTLALALAASVSLAKPRPQATPTRHTPVPAVSATAESLLARLLNWLGGVWAKEGCVIDPDGRCLGNQGTTVAPPADAVDEGCVIDPSGACSEGR